ncbi:MAG: S41 family peptidase [Candidatus Staskawiczbacteria bacterium]|nr:S41 family peptidase [Candidatus Staskawiczbacteria bacterium]
MFDFNYKNLTKYLIVLVALILVFGAGFYYGKNKVICNICKPEQVNFSLFWDAYNKLHEGFIDKENINENEIIYGAISGMTKSLGDPYTDFFDPSQAKIFQQDLSGSFDGIGVEIGIKKDQLTVISPLKGTPGERAGLASGDIIVAVDGKSTSNMTIDEAVSLVRGKRGTQVELTVYRESWGQAKDIKITRDTIKIDSVSWELKDLDVAYIKINQFNQSLPTEFTKIARDIMTSSAKKIILDLRNNPGGYLEVCQDISGWFLKSGEIVTIEDFGSSKESKKYLAEGNGLLANYPIVVLINSGSASASEILAGALRDNRGIKLVGEKSFGKGSVQEVVVLQDKVSFLKITVAKWLTPKGDSISEVGLEPDVKVELDQENMQNDTQLNKALEIIKELK